MATIPSALRALNEALGLPEGAETVVLAGSAVLDAFEAFARVPLSVPQLRNVDDVAVVEANRLDLGNAGAGGLLLMRRVRFEDADEEGGYVEVGISATLAVIPEPSSDWDLEMLAPVDGDGDDAAEEGDDVGRWHASLETLMAAVRASSVGRMILAAELTVETFVDDQEELLQESEPSPAPPAGAIEIEAMARVLRDELRVRNPRLGNAQVAGVLEAVYAFGARPLIGDPESDVLIVGLAAAGRPDAPHELQFTRLAAIDAEGDFQQVTCIIDLDPSIYELPEGWADSLEARCGGTRGPEGYNPWVLDSMEDLSRAFAEHPLGRMLGDARVRVRIEPEL